MVQSAVAAVFFSFVADSFRGKKCIDVLGI